MKIPLTVGLMMALVISGTSAGPGSFQSWHMSSSATSTSSSTSTSTTVTGDGSVTSTIRSSTDDGASSVVTSTSSRDSDAHGEVGSTSCSIHAQDQRCEISCTAPKLARCVKTAHSLPHCSCR